LKLAVYSMGEGPWDAMISLTVDNGPWSDMAPLPNVPDPDMETLFDHVIGDSYQRRRNVYTQSLGCL
jgi:hypothetical protein